MENLTEKQRDIYKHLLSAMPLSEIRNELRLTKSAFSFHCRNIYKKMGVSNHIELLAEYRFNGLPIRLPEFSRPLTDIMEQVLMPTIKGYSIQETAEIIGVEYKDVSYARMKIYWSAGVSGLLELLLKCYVEEEVEIL